MTIWAPFSKIVRTILVFEVAPIISLFVMVTVELLGINEVALWVTLRIAFLMMLIAISMVFKVDILILFRVSIMMMLRAKLICLELHSY